MGEPARKIPADWESESPPEDADPFRYGWRWRTVRLPNGEVTEQQIPLTAEDLLNPELGDEVPVSIPHSLFVRGLAGLLSRRYRPRPDVLVVDDVIMLWGIPGLKEPAPDIAVIPGMRTKPDLHSLKDRRSFDVVQEGTRPCLIIELVSPPDPALRRNDYEDKVKIYQQAGVPEYVIMDPPFSRPGRLLLTGHRLGPGGRYRRIKPDAQGRLLSETTGLLFGVDEDGETLLVFDAVTGERLFFPDEQSDRDAEARRQEAEARGAAEERAARAEEQAAREAEARKAAEAEVAKLRTDLEELRRARRAADS
jgi:Uma2 family endonuclease